MNLSNNQKILLIVFLVIGLYLYLQNKEHVTNISNNQATILLNYAKDVNNSQDVILVDPKNNAIFTIYKTPNCHHILLLNNIKFEEYQDASSNVVPDIASSEILNHYIVSSDIEQFKYDAKTKTLQGIKNNNNIAFKILIENDYIFDSSDPYRNPFFNMVIKKILNNSKPKIFIFNESYIVDFLGLSQVKRRFNIKNINYDKEYYHNQLTNSLR